MRRFDCKLSFYMNEIFVVEEVDDIGIVHWLKLKVNLNNKMMQKLLQHRKLPYLIF